MNPATPAAGADRAERGFTLVELMIVVLVVGVLLAIAIPTYLGARTKASDRAAQSVIRHGLDSAASVLTEADQAPPTTTQIQKGEPALHVVTADTAAAARRNEVSVRSGTVGGDTFAILASGSTSGRCYAVLQLVNVGTRYRTITQSDCTADRFAPGDAWADQW
jgi:type IV pilus assembly protein PilA